MPNTFTPSPPAAVTGVNAVAAVPCVSVLVAIACVVVSGDAPESICRLNVVLPEFPAWSVTVTVNVVCAMLAIGVPLTRTSAALYKFCVVSGFVLVINP